MSKLPSVHYKVMNAYKLTSKNVPDLLIGLSALGKSLIFKSESPIQGKEIWFKMRKTTIIYLVLRNRWEQNKCQGKRNILDIHFNIKEEWNFYRMSLAIPPPRKVWSSRKGTKAVHTTWIKPSGPHVKLGVILISNTGMKWLPI